MKTILITGGNGFLGSEIIKDLISEYRVVVLQRTFKNERLKNYPDIKIYTAHHLEQIFKENKIDIIIHAATVYGRYGESSETILDSNFLMPFRLLQFALKNKVSTFINVDTVLDKNTNDYSFTKAQFREWLMRVSDKIQVVNMQLEHFYGPGGNKDNFITIMSAKMLQNQPEIDFTKGEQKRDFIYIGDVVSAFNKVIKCLGELKQYNEFQVASGEAFTIRQMLESIKKITSSNSRLNFGNIPYRQNELMFPESDNRELIKLGWQPKTSFEDGITKTINDLKKNL